MAPKTHVQPEPWLQAGGDLASCTVCSVRLPAPGPRSLEHRPLPPAHISGSVGRDAPCARLPAGEGQSSCQGEVLQSHMGLPGDGEVAFGLGSCLPTDGPSLDCPCLGLWLWKEREVPALNCPSLCFLRNLNEPESKERVETLR